MIKNYFKPAWQNLIKNKTFSAINSSGLAIGIARDYVKLVLIAAVITLPVGYFLLNNWLSKYAFRISIDVWFFLLPVFIIGLIAFITVIYQSIRAAISNPAKSLRTE